MPVRHALDIQTCADLASTEPTSVAERLHRRGLVAHTVFVKFSWSDFTTFTRRRTLAVPMDRDEDVVAVVSSLWLGHWPERRKVRLVGVGLADLEPADARQLPLELG